MVKWKWALVMTGVHESLVLSLFQQNFKAKDVSVLSSSLHFFQGKEEW